jgi:hypothetical protein
MKIKIQIIHYIIIIQLNIHVKLVPYDDVLQYLNKYNQYRFCGRDSDCISVSISIDEFIECQKQESQKNKQNGK